MSYRRTTLFVWAGLLALAASVCHLSSPAPKSLQPLAQEAAQSQFKQQLLDEDDIRETVFRYEFENNLSGERGNVFVYCLSLGEKGIDPTDEFMKRFANYRPSVQKASLCSSGALEGVHDKRTGRHGLIFRITGIRWINVDQVSVTGGYYSDGLSSSVNTYTVLKQGAKWIVIVDKLEGIS